MLSLAGLSPEIFWFNVFNGHVLINVTLSFPVQWKKKTEAPSMPLMRVKVPYMAGFCSYEAKVPVRKLANTCDWSGEVT